MFWQRTQHVKFLLHSFYFMHKLELEFKVHLQKSENLTKNTGSQTALLKKEGSINWAEWQTFCML